MFDSTIDFFAILLFESPFRLILAAVVGGAVLGYLYQREPGPKYGRAIVALAALIPVMLIVQRQVVTDREQIRALIADLADAVENNDATSIINSLDKQYDGQGLNKTGASLLIRALLSVYEVNVMRLTVRIEPNAKPPQAHIGSLSEVGRGAARYGVANSVWIVEFRERAGGWKVSNVRPVTINGRRFDSLSDIPR